MKASRRIAVLVIVGLLVVNIMLLTPLASALTGGKSYTLNNHEPDNQYIQVPSGGFFDPSEEMVPNRDKIYANGHYTGIALLPEDSTDVTGDFDLELYEDYDFDREVVSSYRGLGKMDTVVVRQPDPESETAYFSRILPFEGENYSGDDHMNYAIESDSHSGELYDDNPDSPGPLQIGETRTSALIAGERDDGTKDGNFFGSIDNTDGHPPLLNVYSSFLYKEGTYDLSLPTTEATEDNHLSYHIVRNHSAIPQESLASGVVDEVNGVEEEIVNFTPEQTGWYGIVVLNHNRDNPDHQEYDILLSGDHGISASPKTRLISPEINTEYDVEITAEGAVNPIDLDLQWLGGAPTGVNAYLDENKVHPDGNTVNETKVFIEATNASPGEYPLRIWANSTADSGSNHSSEVDLIIEDQENFYIDGRPDYQKVGVGTDFSYEMNVSAINNFNDPVDLSVDSVSPSPNGELTWDFGTSTLNSPYPNETSLNVHPSTDLQPDTYELIVKGEGGGKTHNTTVELEVTTGLNAGMYSPIEDELISGQYTFQADASYDGGTIDEVRFTFGGNLSTLGTLSGAYSTTSGLWERDVDTTGYPDGISTVKATVVGTDGARYTSKPVTFETKNTPPNPTILSPSDHEYVNDAIEIRVNTSEKISDVQYRIDEQAWQPMIIDNEGGNSISWLAQWDTTSVSDGLHDITIEATDKAGLSGQSSTTVYVDNNPPSLDIVSPVNGETIQGQYKFQALAEDTVKMDRVNITVFGSTTSMVFNEVTGYYERTFRTSTVSDGNYTAHMQGWDRVGHSSQNQSVDFQVANAPPSMTIHSPQAGQILQNTHTLKAEVESDFLETVEYRVDDGAWETMEENTTLDNYTADWDTTAVPDGPHTLTFRAVDEVGHETEVSRDVKVDNTAPTGTVVEPLNGEFISGEYTFRITASDEVGVKSVEIKVFSGIYPATYNEGTGYYEYSIDTNSIDDGEYTVNATIEDEVGWTYTTSDVTFSVDNSAPAVSIVNPTPNSYVSGNVSVETNITDMYLDSAEARIDEGTWEAMEESNNLWTYEWNTSDYSEGEHQIHVRAMDDSGKSTMQNINVIVDNENPTASIISPNPDADIQGTYTFQVSANDENGVDVVSINVFGENYTAGFNQGTGFYEKSIITTTVEDGDHAIEATVKDDSGKETVVDAVNFSVDNTNPAVDIVAPNQGDYIDREIEINATTHDKFLKNSHYRIDGGSWNEMDIEENYSTAYWNTTKFSEGHHRIEVRSVDEIGHQTMDSIDIIVDNEKPGGSIASPFGGEYVSGSFIFQISAEDENGIDQVKVDVFNQTYTAEYNSGTGMYELVLVTTTIEDGTYNISATIKDNAGWEIELDPINFHVNNEEPTLSIVGPEAGKIMTGKDEVRVRAEDKFLSGVRYRVGDSGWHAMDEEGNEEWTSIIETSNFTDGAHTIQFEAIDRGGLRTRQSVEVIFDNTGPEGEIVTPSESDFVDERIRFQINADDEVGVERVMINFLEVEGENASDIDELETQEMYYDVTTGSYMFEVATFRYTDGEARFNATVIDKAGFRTDLGEVDFFIDNSPPEVEYLEPLQGDFVSGTVNITAEIDDDPFIPEVEYRINERTWSSMERERDEYSFSLNRTEYEECLEEGVINETLRQAFEDKGYEVEEDANLSEEDGKWFVSEDGKREYRIELSEEELNIYELGRGWIAEWDTTTIVDGEHTIAIRARDDVGHVTLNEIEVTVDNHEPKVEILNPVSDQFIEGDLTFQIRAADKVGIETVVLDIYALVSDEPHTGNWTIEATYNPSTGYHEATLDTTLEQEDGYWNVTASATDLSGKMNITETIEFRVVNHDPSLTINSPRHGEYVSGQVEVDAEVEDAFPGPAYYSVDDGGWTPIIVPWNTTGYSDGEHSLDIMATDQAGNSVVRTIRVTVINTEPEASIVSPIEEQFVEDWFQFRVNARHEVEVESVEAHLFNETLELSFDRESGYYVYEIDTRNLADGTYTFNATATDPIGNMHRTNTISFHVDNNAPELDINSPRNGEYIRDTVELNVTSEDEFMKGVMYSVDDTGFVPISEELNTTRLSDGEHTITVRATDEAGHITTRKVTVIVDNVAPTIRLHSPRREEVISGEHEIKVFVDSEVQEVMIEFEGNIGPFPMEKTAEENKYSYLLQSTKLTGEDGRGVFDVNVTVVDVAGHERGSQFEITVDNAGPMIEMTGPVENILNETSVQGSTTFSLNVSSLAGVENVQINIDGRGWQDMMLVKNNTYMYQWEAAEEDDGEHTYVIRIEDSAGNVNQYSGTVEVDNPPDYWGIFQNNIPGISFLLILILIVFILYLGRNEVRERIKREEKEGEEGEKEEEEEKESGWISSPLSSKEEEKGESRGASPSERKVKKKKARPMKKTKRKEKEKQEEQVEKETGKQETVEEKEDQGHSIEVLNLNGRVEARLKNQEITSVEELTNKTKDELKNIKGIGEKRAEHLEEKLKEMGLSLKSEKGGKGGDGGEEKGLMDSVMEADLPSDKE